MGLENMISLIVRLNKENWHVISIIGSPELERFFDMVPVYKTILEENSVLYRLKPKFKIRNKLFTYILNSYRTLFILLKILCSSHPRIIYTDKVVGLRNRILRIISLFKGKFYVISTLHSPLKGFSKDYLLNALNDPEKRKFMGKKPGNFVPYNTGQYFGTFLIHSEFETEDMDIRGYPEDRITIGYPKLQRLWLDYVSDMKVCWDHERLEKEKSFIVVLLSSPGIYLFDETDSCDNFLREILCVIRKFYKDELVVLKPKPYRTKVSSQWFEEVLDEFDDPRIIQTNIPTPFLALKTSMLLMMNDTTASFDFLVKEIPSIIHTRYNEGFMKICGGWFHQQLGVRRTSTAEELEAAIKDVKYNCFCPMSIETMKQTISHEDHDEVFKIL
jgi:hypothetical protein